MKLHLPKLLRNSVLACITAVAGIVSTTVGTATFTGGVVAFALVSQQVAAETATVSSAQLIGEVKTDSVTKIEVNSGGVLTFSNADDEGVVGVELTDGLVINDGGSVVAKGNLNTSGFVTNTTPVTINAGGTLRVTEVDVLGYSGGGYGGAPVQSITIAGESGKTANLIIDKRQTLTTSLTLGGYTSVTIGEGGITDAANSNRGGIDIFHRADGTSGATITVSGTNNSFDAYIIKNRALQLSLANAAEIKFSRSVVGSGAIDLNATGDSSIVTYEGDVTADTLHTNRSDITFGNGTDACTATFGRVEIGNSNASGSHTVTLSSNAKLVITGNNNGTDYKRASLLIGEWNTATTMDVAGTLVAANANLLTGDSGGILNLQSGSVVAVNGIGVASVKSGKSQKLDLNMAAGSTLVVGLSGIDMRGKAFNTAISGGTIGTLADSVSINPVLTVTGDLTIDTTLYSINNAAVSRGTAESTLYLKGGVAGEGTVSVVGSGTLYLQGATVGADIVVNEGALGILGGLTLENGATITIGENAVLKDSLAVAQTENWGPSGGESRLAYKVSVPSSSLPSGVINNGKLEVDNVVSGHGSISDTTVTFLDKSLKLDEIVLNGGKYAIWEQDTASETSAFLKQADKVTLNNAGFLALSSYFNGGTAFTNTGLDFDIEVGRDGAYFVAYGDATADFKGAVSGSGAITKTDVGTVTLSGDMSGYTGSVSVRGGELVIGKLATLSSIDIASGATLTAGEGINITSDLSFSGGQTLDFGEGSTLSNNLVNVAGDGVTLKGKVTGANTALRHGVDGTITISGSNTAVTVNRFVGGDNDGAETILKITDGATFTANRSDWNTNPNSAAFMLGHWGYNNAHSVVDIENGSVNVLYSGVSVKDGFGIINVEENGIFNIKALAGSQKDKITVNLNGGMINIGELGIAQNSVASANTDYDIELNLNGGTLGILDTATSWQTWKELELKGDTTINTDLYAAKTDGTHGAYTGKAGTITLNAGVTGDYMLTKSGVGTLVLGSVENLKISSGYVKALTGGLTIGTSLATMTAEGGRFLYSGLANSTADKITAANYAGPLFLTLDAPEAGTYALFQGSNSLTAAQVNVELLANRGLSATVQEVVDGLVQVKVSGQADTNTYDLQWNAGHQDNVWSNSSTENWYTSGTTTANRFSMGDNVEFAGTAGETITVPFDVTAGTIKVSTTGYTLKGDGKVTTTSLTVEDGVEFTLETAPGNALGDVNLGAGSTLNLGVNSSGALSNAIGDGAFTLEGSATVNITAGNITWARVPQGDNAALALVVQNGASMTLNTSSEKITSLTVEKGGTMVINNAGQNPRSVGTITVRGQLNTTGDAFGWGNPATGRLTMLLIDEGTWKMTGGNNTFSNLPVVLDKGVIEMGTNAGGWDFFSDNETGNKVTTLATAKGQSVICLVEGATSDMTSGTNKIGVRRNLTTFDIARATVLADTDISDLRVDVGLYRKDDQSGAARCAFVKKGTGILELTAGFVNNLDVDLTAGTLRLSGSAQLKDGTLAMTAGSTLDLNLSSSASSAGAITGSGTIVKRNSGSVSLTGLSADWTGKIALQKGTLGMGDALALGTGRTLEVAGGKLDSALTLAGGSLVLNGALDLNSHDLNLSADNKASLSFGTGFVPSEFDSLTLISGISSLTGITVDDTTSLGDLFSISDMTLADYKVVYSDNTLTLTSESVEAPALEWNPTNDSIWKDTGAVGEDTFYNADVPNVSFGAVAGTETVTVEGTVTANKVTINPGADGVYEFIAADGEGNQITAGEFQLASGTLVLGSGVIGSEVDLAMGGDTTLKWGEGNTTDYSGQLTIRGNATLDAGSNSVTLANEVGGMTADSTTTLKGNFTLVNDTVLKGSVVIDGGILTLQGNGDTDADNYNQNFSGSGSLSTTSNHGIHLKGTNTYEGATDLKTGSVLHIDTYSAYSAASKMTGAGNLNLNAAGEYAWNMDSDLTGTVTIASGATVKVTGATSVAFAGAGGLTVDGSTAETPIVWNATNKTYTGTTTIAADTQVNTTGPLSGGAVTLAAETSILKITPVTSASIQTGFDGKAVSGPGKVVIDATSVSSVGSDSAKTIYSRVLGALFAANSGTTLEMTGDGSVLNVGGTNEFLDKVAKVVITDGARYNVNATTSQNTTISLAGDGLSTAEAGTMAAAAMSFDGNNSNSSNIDLAAASTIFVTSEKTGTLAGTITGNGHTLTKTGAGTLKVYLDKLITNENDKFDVDAGTLELNCKSKLDAYSVAALDIANEAAVKICVHDDRVLTIGNGLSVDGVVTMNSHLASTTDIACAVTGDAESTIMLAQGNGATMSISAAQAYAGTWKIGDGTADGNWSLKASHADALKDATVNLNDSDAKLVLGVDKANLAKLTGTAGTVTGSGKVLNIANALNIADAETSGVEYSGAIGDGVTIQVSEGYQKITGADKTGTYTLSTIRTSVPEDDGLGGGALLLSEGTESVAPVLDLTGYAHSAADDAGVTTILAGNQGSIKGLVLGKNMLLTTMIGEEAATQTHIGVINDNLTLAGGKVLFHLTGSSAEGDYAYTGDVKAQYDLGGSNLVLTADTKTMLTFAPESLAGKLERRTYQLITNISSIEGIDDWTAVEGDANVFISEKVENLFGTNFSVEGRTVYRIVRENWVGDTYALSLEVSGGAATLEWNGVSGTWKTKGDEADTPWDNTAEGEDNLFWDDDHVVFNSTESSVDVTISDEDGVRIGSMSIVGAANYTFTGDAITSGEGMGQVNIGTTEEGGEYTGTVTFANANSWKGSTNINSGAVVAKNAAALSDTTVNLKGGSLTVDGVALDAVVDMLGGTLVGKGTASATVDLSDATAAKSVSAAAGTLTVTVAEGGMAGNITINNVANAAGTVKIDTGEGKVTSSGAITVAGGTLDITGTLESSSTIAVNAGKLDITGTVKAAGVSTGEDAVVELGASTLEITGDSLTGSIESAGGTLKSSAENGTTLSKLTIGGENTDTTLSGSWTIGKSSVTWDEDATGKLVLAESSTLKLTEDTTLQRVQASADGSNIVKAANAGDLTLSVGFINLNTTIGEGITLKVTGQSDTQDDATWISEGAEAGAVVIDVAESYTEVSGNAAYLATSTTDSVEIKRGRVLLHSGDITVNKGITLNGDGAILATQLTDIATAEDAPADITLINGKLEGFGNYAGTIDINDGGIWRDYDLGGLTDTASVHLGLLSVIGAADKLNETAGYSSLTNLGSLKLAGTNIVTLSEAMKGEDAKAIFNTTGAISLADGADLTFGVNSLAAKMNNGDTVKLHVGGNLTGLAGKALFDASLSLMNITATLGADGYLTLTKIEPTSENIFVSTDEGDTGGEVPEEVVISGENAYTATEGYTGIVVDHNTTIDLTESSRNENQTDGMVLSNLMGTATSSEDGSSTTLTIEGSNATAQEGKQNDLVTINPNLDHAEMEEAAGGVMEEAGVKDALSFDGDIKVSGADLQYKATDSQTGELAKTTYNVNGNLTADEHSQVIVTSGVLALNGDGNDLLGGVEVNEESGTLSINGDTTLGGEISASAKEVGTMTSAGIKLGSDTNTTLTEGTTITSGVQIAGADSTSSIKVEGTTTVNGGASISGSTLSVGEGKTLTVTGEGTTLDVSTITLASGSTMKLEDGSATVKAEGLAGSGALESTAEATVQLTVSDETTYSGDLSNYTGSLCVQGEGVQVLSGDASGKNVDLHIGEKPASMFRMTRVAPAAEDAAVASHVDLDMRKNDLEYRDIYLHNENSILCVFADRADGTNGKLIADDLNLHSGTLNLHLNLNADDGQNSIIDVTHINLDGAEVHVNVAGISDKVAAALFDGTLSSITLATAGSVDGVTAGNITADGIITKYFGNSASVNVVGTNLVLSGTLVTAEDASWYQDNAESANGTEGAKMLDYAFGSGEQQKNTDLADVLDTVETFITSGNITAADEAMAAVAGASTAVLGMATMGDVDRQLQAIRNRTTTMGVDQSVANEDMPYFNAWINAEGDRRELSESGTEAGYELSSWGGTVGFDVDFTPTFTAGMALTAMYGDLDVTGADKATGDLDTQYLSVFARYAPSAWTHTFVGTVGMSDISLNRTVAGVDVEGETEGMSFGLMYEVGRVFALTEDGSTCLQPVFNVTWKHTAIDAYTEDGSDLALEVDEQTLDTVTFGLGARLQTVVGESMYNRTSILEARVLAKADVGDRSGSADVALSALPGAKASVDSAEMGAFGLEAGAGLTIPVGDEGGSIFMDASVELRSDYTNVNGTVGYRINF